MVFISHNELYAILFIFNTNKCINYTLHLFCLTSCSDANERTTRSFSASGVFNYTTLHLSKEDNMLYVGARETVFALNLTDISEVTLQRNVRAKRL